MFPAPILMVWGWKVATKVYGAEPLAHSATVQGLTCQYSALCNCWRHLWNLVLPLLSSPIITASWGCWCTNTTTTRRCHHVNSDFVWFYLASVPGSNPSIYTNCQQRVSMDEGLVTQSVGAVVVSNVPVGRAPISGGNATDHPTNF